jgi:hypothetical protein
MSKKFDPVYLAFNQAALCEYFNIDHTPLVESHKIPYIDDGDVLFEYIGETALGQTALQRHLAPLIARADTSAGTGIVSFSSTTGSLTGARCDTSPNSFGCCAGSFGR